MRHSPRSGSGAGLPAGSLTAHRHEQLDLEDQRRRRRGAWPHAGVRIEQYLETVRSARERFVEPSKRYADVFIPEGGLDRPALEVPLARVRELAVDGDPGHANDVR